MMFDFDDVVISVAAVVVRSLTSISDSISVSLKSSASLRIDKMCLKIDSDCKGFILAFSRRRVEESR